MFLPPPILRMCIALLRSPKGGCCWISDDLSCSFNEQKKTRIKLTIGQCYPKEKMQFSQTHAYEFCNYLSNDIFFRNGLMRTNLSFSKSHKGYVQKDFLGLSFKSN